MRIDSTNARRPLIGLIQHVRFDHSLYRTAVHTQSECNQVGKLNTLFNTYRKSSTVTTETILFSALHIAPAVIAEITYKPICAASSNGPNCVHP